MMNKYFMAIQKYPYTQPKPVFVLHKQVVELHPEATRQAEILNESLNKDLRNGVKHSKRINGIKTYKCLCCGLEWKQSITSPLIVDADTVNSYYKNHMVCEKIE